MEALRATSTTGGTNSSRYLYWRSPVWEASELIYVDALFALDQFSASVQFGGLVADFNNNNNDERNKNDTYGNNTTGGRDVSHGNLTLDDLSTLFRKFGYDLMSQTDSEKPALLVAKGLLALHTQQAVVCHSCCDEGQVAIVLTVGPNTSASFPLFQAHRGDSQSLNAAMVQRLIHKAIATPTTTDPNDDSKGCSASELHELNIHRALDQWKNHQCSSTSRLSSQETARAASSPAVAAAVASASPAGNELIDNDVPVKKRTLHKSTAASSKPKMARLRPVMHGGAKKGFAKK
jgi:hypothetical protein